MDAIGVRELRQNASVYLARVAAGETLRVTDRGRPVALLTPVGADRFDELVHAGHVVVPAGDGDDGDVGAEAPADYGVDASAALAALRADER